MKRLVFCFDGTWNKLAADTPTNVVLTAASIERTTRDGISQIIHYDEGVGTGRLERLSGGMFGAGLLENVREAYRFLIFNYDPGDEIFVFGFSRGAFSARTFVGLLRHAGTISRIHADRIDEAIALYRRRLADRDGASDAMRRFRAENAPGVCVPGDDPWRCTNVDGYQAGSARALTIRYLGLWDTVAALGVPEVVPGSRWFNRKERFHDASLDAFVESARHALALDERRALFPPVPFENIDALNEASGHAADDPQAPFQQRWFPGVHGGVGGGGDVRGLSDGALAWVLQGAKRAGLHLDVARGTRVNGLKPDPSASLNNSLHPQWSATSLANTDRKGPSRMHELSASALRRWRLPASSLPERSPYRPASLRSLAPEIERLPRNAFEAPPELLAEHVVQPGDTLYKLARRFYGNASKWKAIEAANEDVVDDPDDIFVGQTIRMPVVADRDGPPLTPGVSDGAEVAAPDASRPAAGQSPPLGDHRA